MMNCNVNVSSSRTQVEKILAHLLAGGSVTALEALDRYSCSRLAARIGDIRGLGYPIRAEMVALDNGKRVARYSVDVAPVRHTAEVDPVVVEPRQVGLDLEAESDGPSWLSRARWEL